MKVRLLGYLRTQQPTFLQEPSSQDGDHGSKIEEPKKPGFPRSLSHLELTDVRMGDAGFGCLVDWLRCLLLQDQIRGGVPDRPILKTLILRSVSATIKFIVSISFD